MPSPMNSMSWDVLDFTKRGVGSPLAQYSERRSMATHALLEQRMSEMQLQKQLEYQMRSQRPTGEARKHAEEQTRDLLGAFMADAHIPASTKQWLQKSILDTTSGAPLIRQDLDPILTALYVQKFPAWDRIKKVEANGLVHAYDVMTDPANGAALGSSVIQDLTTVTFYSTDYQRKTTANVAEFAVGRGVGLKEIGAVRGGGMPWNVGEQELANGMVQLARDAEYYMLQGNASNAAGTANNEGGAYNQYAFDGLRGIVGGYGTFAGNGAIQVDQGSGTLFQSIKSAAAQAASNGGMPTAAFMTYARKEALDLEMFPSQRFNGGALAEVEIIPGVKSQAIPYVNGQLTIIPVPGTYFGAYVDPISGVSVEDVYILDESTTELAWLFNEGWTVLELPVGYSNDLSARYIVFGLWTMAVKAPLFDAKVRCPQN